VWESFLLTFELLRVYALAARKQRAVEDILKEGRPRGRQLKGQLLKYFGLSCEKAWSLSWEVSI
jgi:hypothetical protein